MLFKVEMTVNIPASMPKDQADAIKAEEFDALVVPGGRAPEYLRLNEKMLEMVRHFAKANNLFYL